MKDWATRVALIMIILGVIGIGIAVSPTGNALSESTQLPNFDDAILNLSVDLFGLGVGFLIFERLVKAYVNARVYEREFRVPEWMKEIKKAKHKVEILNTWTRLITDFENGKEFTSVLRNLIEGTDVRIRILLLAPDAQFAEKRAKDLQREDVYEKIQLCMVTLEKLQKEFAEKSIPAEDKKQIQDRFQVRITSDIPAIALNRVDDHGYVGFYPESKQSSEETQLYFNFRNSQTGQYMARYFDRLWSNAVPVKEYRSLQIVRLGELDGKKDEAVMHVRYKGYFYLIHGDWMQERVTKEFSNGNIKTSIKVYFRNSDDDNESENLPTEHILVGSIAQCASEEADILRKIARRKYTFEDNRNVVFYKFINSKSMTR